MLPNRVACVTDTTFKFMDTVICGIPFGTWIEVVGKEIAQSVPLNNPG